MRMIITVFLFTGCVHIKDVGNCDWARDIRRVCAHQGRDCGTIVCAGETLVIKTVR